MEHYDHAEEPGQQTAFGSRPGSALDNAMRAFGQLGDAIGSGLANIADAAGVQLRIPPEEG